LPAVPLSLSRPALGSAPQGTGFILSREALPGVSVPVLTGFSAAPENLVGLAGLSRAAAGMPALPGAVASLSEDLVPHLTSAAGL
jgi:hypothetical protein